jgi:FkbM family methyltransferase
MSLKSTLKFIINHSLNKDNKIAAVNRFLKWQFNTRLNPYPIIYPFTTRSRLIVQKGMTGATGNLYCGLHDFNDMFFLLHFLRKGDLFVDIGANIGSYTVLAAAHCGVETISIEPVPATFSHLMDNISINHIAHIATPLNMALGSIEGTITFTSSYDTVNHVATAEDKNTIDVQVNSLDHIIGDRNPALIKIDVEGYETEVLAGAQQVLQNTSLKAIIIELNGSGGRYGYDENKIHDLLLSKGFLPFIYEPFLRELKKVESFGSHNTIYLRDIDFIQARLKTAEKVEILNKSV